MSGRTLPTELCDLDFIASALDRKKKRHGKERKEAEALRVSKLYSLTYLAIPGSLK